MAEKRVDGLAVPNVWMLLVGIVIALPAMFLALHYADCDLIVAETIGVSVFGMFGLGAIWWPVRETLLARIVFCSFLALHALLIALAAMLPDINPRKLVFDIFAVDYAIVVVFSLLIKRRFDPTDHSQADAD